MPSLPARCLVVLACIMLWMLAGFAFHLGGNAYLLLGVPIGLLFQRFVMKVPLASVWVRGSSRLSLSASGWLIAGLLMMKPLFSAWNAVTHQHWIALLYQLATVSGAVGAGFALTHRGENFGRALMKCLLTSGVVGIILMVIPALMRHPGFDGVRFVRLIVPSLLTYVPVGFALEEVNFRGMFDTYLHPDSGERSLASASFVSILWGLWHLPISLHLFTPGVIIVLTITLAFVHWATGIFFSFAWRKSGNLAVPAIVHALIDSVRNGLLLVR